MSLANMGWWSQNKQIKSVKSSAQNSRATSVASTGGGGGRGKGKKK